ncbi:hypothetical protein V8D89_016237 [Ganoderma adspersum]
MRWSSFNLLRNDLYSVIVAYCVDARGDTVLHAEWSAALLQHARLLAENAGIPRDRRPKYYFGPAEVLLMVETALASSQSCIDNIVQHVALWTFMFYTAARPGSLVATDNYPESYLRFEDISITRTDARMAFNVEINIVAWKGGHGLETWSQSFRLSPVQSESHIMIDPGLLIVIIGLRRKAFQEYHDLDSLISGRDLLLHWKDDCLRQPVFCAATARGLSVDVGKPMRYHAFTDYLKTTCLNAGLGDQHMSAYCFRRGAATAMTRVLGGELTKAILHHKQNSETLQRSYAYNSSQQDMTSAILYDTTDLALGRSKYDAPALWRPAGQENQATKRLSFTQALAVSDDLRLLHMQRLFLREVIKNGGGVEDACDVLGSLLDADRVYYEQLQISADNQEGVVQILYGRLSVRCRRLFSDMQGRFQLAQARMRHEEASLPSLDELGTRLQRLDSNCALLSIMDRLQSNGPMDEMSVIACPSLDQTEEADSESNDTLTSAREHFARSLITHSAEWTGKQCCPFCQQDDSLPQETRDRVYRNRSKLQRHIQETHRYLVAKPLLSRPWYDTMAIACLEDSVF